jgi:acyl-CoA reductase-like NAD-dependent aldehyde dehydrogenase
MRARARARGRWPAALDASRADGYFVSPTVFAGVEDAMKIAREETFGPVISALPFDDIDQVIARANDTSFGLGGVWTRDVGKAIASPRACAPARCGSTATS